LALVGERLVQLTWREGKAFVYRASDLVKTGELGYVGEGWGLCTDGDQLVMSDGSDQLTFRDPETLAVRRIVRVLLDGQPVQQLNELECVGGDVYANVYGTESIVRIEKATGRVTAVIDASGLLHEKEREKAEVLNGIAYDPARKVFLLTGKLWPNLFEVQFVQP
jgi:glutaminyl-peptide cyclotransferase